MLFDLQDQAVTEKIFKKFDTIIIGAGAAGITTAITLEKFGKSVALIEGGGLEYSEESQNIYRGDVKGDPYFDLDVTRLRYLGGSTNHWGGWCRPFEKIDFERNYLGEKYEWPIKFKEIDRYKNEACSILEIESSFELKSSDDPNVKAIKFQFSPPVRFSKKYLSKLKSSKLISVFINSNLTKVSGSNRNIHSVDINNYRQKKLNLRAKNFVFSMGGIENSRFLLWIDRSLPGIFFDEKLPIGKYWMEHPHFTLGRALIDNQKVSHNYYSLTDKAQKKLNILNCGFRIERLKDTKGLTKALIKDLLCIAPKLGKKFVELTGKNQYLCGAIFRAAWEQSPDKFNVVRIGNDTDKFGIPKVELNWKKNKIDRKTIKKSVFEFNEWLMKIDGGRIKLEEWMLTENDYPTDDELGGHHHMGGTRMHKSNILGVVDSNCKVFGSENLYIAGSSIFTTGGHNNPTLPIVQFALRLANHLVI